MIGKTIFISLFEGVEAKNILRTPILIHLLKKADLRIVFLMRSKDRIDYYQKEFNNPNVVYEIVEYSRNLGKGFDRFFGLLKFLLLRTSTTKIRRKIALEISGNYFVYYLNYLLNFLLARRLIRKFIRYLDFLITKNEYYVSCFDKYKPDLVFLAHLFEEPEINILREAKKRGVKSIGLVNSWDKVTARCIMRLLPDRAIVFNDLVKEEMIKYNDMSSDHIFVSGLPQYDHYFTEKVSPRETFFKKIGVNPEKKLIVYAPFGRTFSNADWEMIDLLYGLNSQGRFGNNVEIFVRFQPNDFLEENELKKRPYLKYDYPGKRFSSNRGVDWDMNFEELNHLRNTLYHMSLLICWAGSIAIDAAVFNKPVINPCFRLANGRGLFQSPIPHYYFEHYKKVLKIGGIRLVSSVEELVDSVNKYLKNSVLDSEGRKLLVAKEVKYVDGRSGERIAEFILSNLPA